MIPLKKKDEEISNLGSTARKLAEDYINFNYDTFTEGDTYKSLEKRYDANGQKAMQNTLGQVAARTGGMASSYATSAANQSYNDWMSNLEDAARSLYESERQEMGDRYALANSMYLQGRDEQRYADELAYNRGRDTIADQRYAEELAYNRAWNEDERKYNRSEKERLEGENDAITTIEEMIAAGVPIEDIDPAKIEQSGYGSGYWESYATNKTLEGYKDTIARGGTVTLEQWKNAGGLEEDYKMYTSIGANAENAGTLMTRLKNGETLDEIREELGDEEFDKMISSTGKSLSYWMAQDYAFEQERNKENAPKKQAAAEDEIKMHIQAGNGANTLKREFVEDSGRSLEYWENYEAVYKAVYKASEEVPEYDRPDFEVLKEITDMIYDVDEDGNYTYFKNPLAEQAWILELTELYGVDFAANVQTILEAR